MNSENVTQVNFFREAHSINSATKGSSVLLLERQLRFGGDHTDSPSETKHYIQNKYPNFREAHSINQATNGNGNISLNESNKIIRHHLSPNPRRHRRHPSRRLHLHRLHPRR
ncbi:MAG: hypothetical protein Q4C95_12805, partial [Planctomycetia bacterium]|nr:hypothetical protein [Planctomycetia bacterium]